MPLKYIKRIKGIEDREEFKGTWEYIVKHFAFYYNNAYQIYKEAKYGASYWLKEPKLDMFKGTEDKDRLYELNKDLMLTCN